MALKSDSEVLAGLAKQALKAAEELRDTHDDEGKAERLHVSCINLRSFLEVWGMSSHSPLDGSLHAIVFFIFFEARRKAGFSYVERKKLVTFAKNAMKLRTAPGSVKREGAAKFFQEIAKKAEAERKKLLLTYETVGR